jgi:hypothetical protein
MAAAGGGADKQAHCEKKPLHRIHASLAACYELTLLHVFDKIL